MKCLLCTNEHLSKIECIAFSDLKKIYLKKKVNINHLKCCDKIDYLECNECKLRFFFPHVTGNEKFYNQLQNFPWYYLEEKQEYIYASKIINENSKVLEVGCGKGAFAKYIPTTDYTGLEFSQNAIKKAFKNDVRVLNENIDMFSSINQEVFDIVCSFQVLEHVSKPYDFLFSKIRALKSGGKLILAVPSEDSYLKYAINDILNLPPHHITRWPDFTLRYIPKIYGVRCLEIYHEKLAEIHKKNMVSTLIQQYVLTPKLIDLSFKRRTIATISNFLAKPLAMSMTSEMLTNGHAVVAVYEKN